MILRDYQNELVDAAVHKLSERKNTMAVAPTGAGKTIVISALVGKFPGAKTLVLQHRDELVAQNRDKFLKVNPRAKTGVFAADVKSWKGDTTFAMVQTLYRAQNLATMPKHDLLVIDECHHAKAPTYLKVWEHMRDLNPNLMVAGFTATAARGDKKGLKPVFDNVCYQVTLSDLVRRGFLVRPRTFVGVLEDTARKLDGKSLTDVMRQNKTASGDYNMDLAADLIGGTGNNDAVVREWQKLAADRKTIVFCSNIEHAVGVHEAFIRAGVNADCVFGSTKNREEILKRFDDGDLQVLVNVAVLTEGYDSQPVSCVILLRPCSQKSTMLQMIGRALRTVDPELYPGVIKKDALILDFGDSIRTHGDLEQKPRLDDWSADGGSDTDKDCPDCHMTVPRNAEECPVCGHSFVAEQEELEEEKRETQRFDQVMREVDVFNDSPFQWMDLFRNERVMLASGFDAWVGVFSPDGENWHALGCKRDEKRVTRLFVGERVNALAMADDFLRTNEGGDAAKKSKRWLNQPATDKQLDLLARLGYVIDHNRGFPQSVGTEWTKYRAACHANFHIHKRQIERALGI